MTAQSVLFAREPDWRENRPGMRHQLPGSVQSWVYESGSLTQRLRSIYGNSVAVDIQMQVWRTPFLSERCMLNLPQHRYCLIREVMMHADSTPLLLARSIIPADTVKLGHGNLAHLGKRPLGEIIFSYPDLERVAMDISVVKPETWTAAATKNAAIKGDLWGRRTVYAIASKKMLVTEFFLPEILGGL